MKGPILPVSRDRRISDFPKCYTPEACLQLREDFHAQVRAACQRRNPGTVGLKISKVVVVGDLCVGKTSLINRHRKQINRTFFLCYFVFFPCCVLKETLSQIHTERFCKEVFDRDYKATIGVDFEIERFEIAGVPYNLQIWDTAGQEKFKCIASAYYRGAEVIITVFDLADIRTLDHTKQWLEDALRENHPGSSSVFLVGTKKDLLVSLKNQGGRLGIHLQHRDWSVPVYESPTPGAGAGGVKKSWEAPRPCSSTRRDQGGQDSSQSTQRSNAESERTERDAVRLANEMQAEYWSVSAKTGENVKDFFFRVAALAFERSVLMEMEKSCNRLLPIGTGDFIRIEENAASSPGSRPSTLNCC